MKLLEIIISNVNNGILITTYCFTCNIHIWPPNHYCNFCYKKTGFKKVSRKGVLLEKSFSDLPDLTGYYGIGEFSGIRLIGSVDPGLVPDDRIRISQISMKNNKLDLRFSKIKN